MTFVSLEHSLMYDETLSLRGFALAISGLACSCSGQSGCPVTCVATYAMCCVLAKVDCRLPPLQTLLKKAPPYKLQERAAFYTPRHERG